MKQFTKQEIAEIIREAERVSNWKVSELIPIESEDPVHVAQRINEEYGNYASIDQPGNNTYFWTAEDVAESVKTGFITFGDGYVLVWYDGV